MIAGIAKCRLLRTSASDDWSLTATSLEDAITADAAQGLLPCFVAATIGTTSTCAVDDIPGLADVCQQHSVW